MKSLITLTLSTSNQILLLQIQTRLKQREAQERARNGKTDKDLGLEIVTISSKKV